MSYPDDIFPCTGFGLSKFFPGVWVSYRFDAITRYPWLYICCALTSDFAATNRCLSIDEKIIVSSIMPVRKHINIKEMQSIPLEELRRWVEQRVRFPTRAPLGVVTRSSA